MPWLRSLLFNLLFFLWTVVAVIVFLPCLVMPDRLGAWVARVWMRGILGLLKGVCRLDHEVRGLENLPSQPCIIAAKHQSAWDTMIFPLVLDSPVYVFKRELLRIPLFGWYLIRAGGIPIDRKGGAGALRRLIATARQRLSSGRSIVIFPEGTRAAPGKHLPYHPGTAALYKQLGVPVVPVAVNSGLYWGRREFTKRPGRIVLQLLPPIAPGLPRRDFAAELETRIETASQRLMEEAAGSR